MDSQTEENHQVKEDNPAWESVSDEEYPLPKTTLRRGTRTTGKAPVPKISRQRISASSHPTLMERVCAEVMSRDSTGPISELCILCTGLIKHLSTWLASKPYHFPRTFFPFYKDVKAFTASARRGCPLCIQLLASMPASPPPDFMRQEVRRSNCNTVQRRIRCDLENSNEHSDRGAGIRMRFDKDETYTPSSPSYYPGKGILLFPNPVRGKHPCTRPDLLPNAKTGFILLRNTEEALDWCSISSTTT